MITQEMNEVDLLTKKAWEKNWEDIPLAEILQIFQYVRVKKQMEIFLDVLPKHEKILEGGCGLAPYLIRLRQLGYDVEGIDYNEGPINKVLAYDASLPVKVGDVTAIPYPDGHFGAYLSLGVIEHFSEGPQKAIAEAHRVLKKGGLFLVAVPTRNILMDLKAPLLWIKSNRFLRKLLKKPLDNHYWEQYFKRKDLIRYLNDAGFDVKEIYALDHSHALVSFSSFFRDKKTYDEASPLALKIAGFLEKYLTWQTACQMTLITYKR